MEHPICTENLGDVSKILKHLDWMKNQGYKQSTIERRQRVLLGLQKLDANLSDPLFFCAVREV
ncbi:MAG: hypothetical protein LBE70_04440 [Nitrososphaerota archaeon]|nr:hypothetical protein [Nitrososphaerota archaeon]